MEVGVRARFLLAFISLILLFTPACKRDQRHVIAVIPKATSHLFWVSIEAGARAAGKDLNVDVLWNGPAMETDYSRQIQIMDSMISRRVDGIALAATERKALVAPVERAAQSGIPVTVFDSGLDTENYTTFVATNNYEAGQMAAREMARLIGEKGAVAILAHAPGSFSTMDRERGFQDVIEKEFPKIRIVAQQFGMSDRAKAMAAAENILTAHPDLNGLFGSSEPSSVGAALAIKSRGLSGKLKFISFDSSDSMIEDLKGGTISAMVVQDPFKIGYEAVKTLVDKLNGKNPPKRMDLRAVIVHTSDLEKPEMKQLLSPDVKKYLNQ
jgi:ribose transport system substrate-binding protein